MFPFRQQKIQQQDKTKLHAVVVGLKSMSNESLFLGLQELTGEFDQGTEETNILSLDGGRVEVQFQFLSESLRLDQSTLTRSNFIILFLNHDGIYSSSLTQQLEFMKSFLQSYSLHKQQLLLLIQNFSDETFQNGLYPENEYILEEIIAEFPLLKKSKVCLDIPSSLEKNVLPFILNFSQDSFSWKPISQLETQNISSQSSNQSGDHLEDYKKKKLIPPNSSSILENPIIAIAKAQKEEANRQEIEKNNRLQALKESRLKKRSEEVNSKERRSPLKDLQFQQEERQQIGLKLFTRADKQQFDPLNNVSLDFNNAPPVFKMSLLNDDKPSNCSLQIKQMNQPQQEKRAEKKQIHLLEKNSSSASFKKLLGEQQDRIKLQQQELLGKKQGDMSQLRLSQKGANEFKEPQHRLKTETDFNYPTKVQKNTSRSITPSRQKSISYEQKTKLGSNSFMKLNIEVSNKIIQIEVNEQDTPHTLTYKLLRKCNQQGQIQLVKNLSALIEKRLEEYLTNVENYFMEIPEEDVPFLCRSNNTILQELTSKTAEQLKQTQKLISPIQQQQYSQQLASKVQQKTTYKELKQQIIGEIQIEGVINGRTEQLRLQVPENVPAERIARQFIEMNSLGINLQDRIVEQVEAIQQQYQLVCNQYSDMFQDTQEKQMLQKELKTKIKFSDNLFFQNIQKSQGSKSYRVNLQVEEDKQLRFNFSEQDNLIKEISNFSINHKLSAKNQQSLLKICQLAIKQSKDQSLKKK